MNLWKRLLSSLFRSERSCSPRRVLVHLTGDPPHTPTEHLISKIAGGRGSVPFDWLQTQVGHALYQAELREGGWVLDIGAWGPSLYRADAARLLRELRGDFALLVEEVEMGPAGPAPPTVEVASLNGAWWPDRPNTQT